MSQAEDAAHSAPNDPGHESRVGPAGPPGRGGSARPGEPKGRGGRGARDRILAVAYDLFSHRGVRAVGVDEVIARSGVAKATLYKHFRSKDELVLAFLQLREQRWTLEIVEAQARSRGTTPEERLLAIFDVFDDWFARDDYEACAFVNVLLEMGRDHLLGRASIGYLENIRGIVTRMAEEAGLEDPAEFAQSWHILMKGSIILAAAEDHTAARRAKNMARLLIAQHRPAELPAPS